MKSLEILSHEITNMEVQRLMFVLTRYFKKSEYREQFMAGSIRFSSMSAFTQIIPERGLKEAAAAGDKKAIQILKNRPSAGQQDVMEGTVADLNFDSLPFVESDGLKDFVVADPKARAVGYSYCNIVCFNRVGYKKIYTPSSFRPPMAEPSVVGYDIEDPIAMSDDFGDYAVVILDMKEFINRIQSAAGGKGWKLLAGIVNYHYLKLGNKRITRVNGDRTMIIVSESAFRLDDLVNTGRAVVNEMDAFDKQDTYAMQREYRIAIETGEKSTDAVYLDIGNISDIAVPVPANEVGKMIDGLLLKQKISPSMDVYVGNTSREQMRQDFYELGDGMVNIALVCGGIADYEVEG